jgi:hypothetical protein
MNIVWDKRVAEKLQTNYTVLELETFEKEDKQITAFCVLDSVPITELPNLENIKKLHQTFIDELKKVSEHLKQINGSILDYHITKNKVENACLKIIELDADMKGTEWKYNIFSYKRIKK